MTRLSVHLFGPFHVLLYERPVWGFTTAKDRLLLAYLAVEREKPSRREALAELLWPERPQGIALANLRHTLSTLRKTIQDHTAIPPFLVITRQSLQLNPAAEVWTDVGSFQLLIEEGLRSDHTAERLEQAVCCYSGPFLDGMLIRASPEVENWIHSWRARYYQEFVLALDHLTRFYECRNAFAKALPYAYRMVELEPWGERANHQLVRLLALDGQRSTALAHYQRFEKILREELGISPSGDTQRLCEQIRASSPVADFPLTPQQFHNRLPVSQDGNDRRQQNGIQRIQHRPEAKR